MDLVRKILQNSTEETKSDLVQKLYGQELETSFEKKLVAQVLCIGFRKLIFVDSGRKYT